MDTYPTLQATAANGIRHSNPHLRFQQLLQQSVVVFFEDDRRRILGQELVEYLVFVHAIHTRDSTDNILVNAFPRLDRRHAIEPIPVFFLFVVITYATCNGNGFIKTRWVCVWVLTLLLTFWYPRGAWFLSAESPDPPPPSVPPSDLPSGSILNSLIFPVEACRDSG